MERLLVEKSHLNSIIPGKLKRLEKYQDVKLKLSSRKLERDKLSVKWTYLWIAAATSEASDVVQRSVTAGKTSSCFRVECKSPAFRNVKD